MTKRFLGALLCSTALVLASCGGGGGSSSSSTPSDPVQDTVLNGVAVRTIAMVAGDQCSNGGVSIDTGIDENANGVLDTDEIDNTYVICNGADGVDSTALATAFDFEEVAAGESCTYGGTLLKIGLDGNANGVLDASEVVTSQVLCQGPSSVSEASFTASEPGRITGSLPLATAFQASSGVAKSIMATNQEGNLWLTPNDVLAAIQADKEAAAQASAVTAEVSTPVVTPVLVEIDENGNFDVEVPAGTDYKLEYINPTSGTGVQIADINVNPAVTTTVAVQADDLVELGYVAIQVQSLATGLAVTGATVEILDGASHGEIATVESDGRVTLSDLTAGAHSILISASGYVDQVKTLNMVSGDNGSIIIELNNQKGQASGQLQSAILENLANIVVYARDVDGNVYSTLTDSNGIFRFNGLPVAEGYSFIAQANDLSSTRQEGINIVLGQTASVGTLSLTVQPDGNGSMTGYARFAEYGQLLNVHAGIIVSVEGTDKEGVTARDGAFVINGLAAGSYTVNFTDSNHQTRTLEGVTVVAAGATNLNPVVLSSKTGSVSGSVVDGAGTAVAGATVFVSETGFSTVTNASGVFTLADIYAGDFTLVISKSGYEGVSSIIQVKADSTTSLGVYNIDAYSISGFVQKENATDHSGVLVSLANSSIATVSAADGSFTLVGMTTGSHQVQFASAGYQSVSRSVAVSSSEPNAELDGSLVLAQYRISGVVELAGLTDFSGITVSLVGTSVSAVTAADGSYTLLGMGAGSYMLQYSRTGYQSGSLFVALSNDSPSVDLVSATTLEQFHVSGVVTLAGLEDFSGITVSVVGQGLSTLTSSDGSFDIPVSAAGNYKLQFIRSGYSAQAVDIAVSPDAPAAALTYPVELEPAVGVVRGVVTLAGQVNHGGILVELTGTFYSTLTNAVGEWSMEVPVGNYGEGVVFTRALYAPVTVSETVTVTESGDFVIRLADGLEQIAQRVSVAVEAVAGCSATYVTFTGISTENYGYSLQVGVSAGVAEAVLPYGDYRSEIGCVDSGYETRIEQFTLDNSSGSQTEIQLDDVLLRQSYFNINQGLALTNSADVTLYMGSTNAATMNISDGSGSQSGVVYSDTLAWTLPSADGSYTVSVEFFDESGDSLGVLTDSITLDTIINASSFVASGASTRGDTMKLTLNLGETGAIAVASLGDVFSSIKLVDSGINGDNTAGDGIYTALVPITSSLDISAPVVAHVIDAAGNQSDINSNEVTLATAPRIYDPIILSDRTAGKVSFQFDTDEPANSRILWGASADALINSEDINTNFQQIHTTVINGLDGNGEIHYQLVVTDENGNTNTQTGKTRMTLRRVEDMLATPGNGEIAITWTPNSSLRVSGYHVYRSDDSGASWTQLTANGAQPQSYYLDQNASNGQNYQYRVTVADELGYESAYSEVVEMAASVELAGPTVVDSIMYGTHVWLPSRSPYQLNSGASQEAEGLLRVMPGTIINVEDSFYFEYYGNLWMQGTELSPITLNSEAYTYFYSAGSDQPKALLAAHQEPLAGNYLAYVDIEAVSFFDGSTQTLDSNYVVGYATNLSVSGSTSGCYLQVGVLKASSISNCDIYAAYLEEVVSESIDALRFTHAVDLSVTDANVYPESSASCKGCVLSGVTLELDGRITLLQSELRNTSMEIYLWGGSVYLVDSALYGTSADSDVLVTPYNSYIDNISDWSLSSLVVKEGQAAFGVYTNEDHASADQDGDGIVDLLDTDWDNDGYSDYQEYAEGSDFRDASVIPASGIVDTDGDGLADLDDTDNDNDGIADANELTLGTNPFLADSDWDNVFDSVETLYGYDPLDADHSPLGVTPITGNEDWASHRSDTDGMLYWLPQYYVGECELSNGQSLLYVGSNVMIDVQDELPRDTTLNLISCSERFGSRAQMYLSSLFESSVPVLAYGGWAGEVATAAGSQVGLSFNGVILENLANIPIPSDGSSDVVGGVIRSSSLVNQDYGNGLRVSDSLILDSAFTTSLWVTDSTFVNSSLNSSGEYVHSSYENTEFFNSYLAGAKFETNDVAITDSVVVFSAFDNSRWSHVVIDDSLLTGLNLTGYSYYFPHQFDGGETSETANRINRSDLDITWPEALSYDLELSLFLNQSYLSINGANLFSLGEPKDEVGSGDVGTALTVIAGDGSEDTLYLDGVSDPASTPYFPNGVSDLWTGVGVGPDH